VIIAGRLRFPAVSNEAVLYVRDLDRMAGFYVRFLKLRLAESGDGYRGLRADNFTLWLVLGEQRPQDNSRGDAPGDRRSDVPVKLGFEVPSINLVAPAIGALGGWVSPKSWEFAGYLRQDVADPEGNVLQLLQRLPLTTESQVSQTSR
jgi:catechol 2,3-dioxygenase-like lactoylglutathione lyase family enzyme